MDSRIELQKKLESVLGSRNVYFQPPESIKIKYPAIVYNLGGMRINKADNIPYLKGRYYTVTLLHTDPDNGVIDDIINAFEYCSFDRYYVMENLYHYVFEIYY